MKPPKKSTTKPILFLIGILTLFQINRCLSQTEISGYVFSAKDSTAIYSGSVYFDGTSIGVSTNKDGYFDIQFKENNSPLIISSMGYESVIIRSEALKTSKTLNPIYLTEKIEDLETVYIEIDTLSRSRKLELFKQEFLGKSEAADLCDIINEDAIKLRYIPSTKTLSASANTALIIENHYLGYRLRYNLRDFEITYKTINQDLAIPAAIHYHGFSFFQPIANKISRKILRNRKRSYLGSTLHFMRALYTNTLNKNDFEILDNYIKVPPETYFEITDINQIKQVKLLVDHVIIRYKIYEQSKLFVNDIFTIDDSGHHSPPEAIHLKGKMSAKRISEQLPLGYKP